MKWRVIWIVGLLLLWLFCSGTAQADGLAERLQQFPDWHKPSVATARGDLAYPDWIAGEWTVTTTLVEMVAPLAPEVVTPGFASNERYLNQPVSFRVRFGESLRLPGTFSLPFFRQPGRPVVADRAFNGLNLAKTYLGDRAVYAVKVDPKNPNRQITLLQNDRQLVSTITGRATATPASDRFITTEVFQQVFHGAPQLYVNEVETTTAYQHYPNGSRPPITAEQVTAVYLSPHDPDYFRVGDRPVALYRYRLEFFAEA
ncbi:hypothetical protein IQ268_27535 [Oculatella sp. LEGE 06141]|uniref:DUF6816 family protein n=1 Tax=Oculatella sp. LEGE 06141 TaxID=1828648 RepID=UPI001880E2AC|nr:hypothetical protein [Oculatella sp. LEGE 06141]MBE9182306.1 hypothetical protein [Oculatella sp. LEGE 06141]